MCNPSFAAQQESAVRADKLKYWRYEGVNDGYKVSKKEIFLMLTNVHIKSNIVLVSVFPMGGFGGWRSAPLPPQPF